MTYLNTISKARYLTDQLHNVPQELLKTQFESLLNILQTEETVKLILTNLVERERIYLGANAGAFIKGTPMEHQINLGFANTPEKRAAFGYQVLSELLLNSNMSNDTLLKIVVSVGIRYTYGSTNISDMITKFVEVFIEPIIDYLEFHRNDDDLILALMIKYKQRCEWFDSETLIQQTLSVDVNPAISSSNIEQRLKRDFYRYLFDNGLDFVLEPESPKQKGKADVFTPKLSNEQRLIVEAKVFDGKDRDENWIREGIAQAASYAEEWGESIGYLLVYNIAENCLLEFEGANILSNLWVINSHGKEIRIIDINLNNKLPASKASQLVRHKV